MFWIVLAGLSGTVVVAVSAWARGTRKRVEQAEADRREQQRLKFQEEALLAKKRSGEGER